MSTQTSNGSNLQPPLSFDKEKMERFLAFAKNEVENPPKANELFIIPDNLPPAWSALFQKIMKHIEIECQDRHRNMQLEKRKWLMEDYKLTELEMMLTATNMKEKGNNEFKQGGILNAFYWYMAALNTFPLPDIMLNLAACALKLVLANYHLAEENCTRALELELLSDPSKAYYRRCQARRLQGKFEEAAKDIQLALASHPLDSNIRAEAELLAQLSTTYPAQPQRAAYLATVPKQQPPRTSFSEVMDKGKDLESAYVRVPKSMDYWQIPPPSF